MTVNFNSDPAATGLYRELGNGAAEWRPDKGASGAAGDGYLAITDARGGQQSCLVFKDLENGLVVKAFRFEADLRIGGGTAQPADGFSLNYVRGSDDLLVNADNGVDPSYQNFAGTDNEGSLPEEGSRTGLGIGFDTWQSAAILGVQDVVGVSIRVDGVLITQLPVPLRPGNVFPGGTYNEAPFRNLPSSSPDYASSMQTGDLARDEDLNGDGTVDGNEFGTAQPAFGDDPVNWARWIKNLRWEKFAAELTEAGTVKVTWKGVELTPAGGLSIPGGFAPSSGRVVLAGRTGGAWEVHHIDNISLTTVPSDKVVIGGVASSPIGFSVTTEDSGASVLNPDSVVLKLDGQTVDNAKVTKSKTGATTTISFRDVANPLAVNSQHTVDIVVRDNQGTELTASRTFTVAPYVSVDAANSVASVNTSLPGFNIAVHQVGTGQPNTIIRAERQLRGDLGANEAAVSTYEEAGVINYNQDAPGNAGNFNSGNGFEDQLIPGIPGNAGSTDNIAAEITTFLEFNEAGVYTLIFNSDDGFRTSFGKNSREQLNGQIVSQFDGGRGASDTAVTLLIQTPGFYPVRSVWFEGGGGANLEWVVQREGKPRALINDGSANSIRAFRATTAATPAAVVFASPGKGTGNPYGADEAIVLDIADPSNGQVNNASIALKINDAVVTPTKNKLGSITTVRYAPAAPLASGATVKVELAFSDSTGGNYSGSYTYTVAAYASIPASMRMPDNLATTPGFLFKTIQSDQGLENRVRRADYHTRGLLGLPNYADLTSVGANGYFAIPGVINFDQGAGNQGNFNGNNGFFEEFIPGIPGTLPNGNQSTDNISAEILTLVRFPTAGLYTLVFNSDDGFATWFGHPNDRARVFAGQFDGGRGASDTAYQVLINQPGLYPIRTVWFEGGGGANLEWFTRKSDGTRALLNDTANGGLQTYQYPLGSGPSWVKTLVPANGANRVDPTAPIRAVIADGTGNVDVASVSLKVDGAVVPATIAKNGSDISVSFTPSLTPDADHTVELAFADRVVTRTFRTGNLQGVAFFIEAEDFNHTSGQSEAAASDMATYRGGAYAGKAAVVDVDYSRGNEGSSPWYRIGEDPQVPMDVNYAEAWGRGFTDLQINFKIGWIGGGNWYNYTRNIPAGKYNVYAGLSHGESNPGQLSGSLQKVTAGATTTSQTLEQLGTFTGQGTGGWGVNRLVPLQDSNGQNVALDLGGTTTLRYTSNNGDFDYLLLVKAVAAQPEITDIRLNANGSITIEWSGSARLQAGPSISGPWADVPGATSPYTFTPDAGVPALYGRLVQ